MNRQIALVILALASLAQLAVPASFILRTERVLDKGTVYRFETAPVDPYDAFRGRYVALQFEQAVVPVSAAGEALPVGATAYARLTTDEEGFARIDNLTTRPPPDGDYFEVRVRGSNPDAMRIELPFDRFYMPEELAPAAEAAYRRGQWDGNVESYAEVRVHRGRAVLAELYLDGVPIAEFVRRQTP